MNSRVTQFYTVVLAQAVCIGVGLWMEQCLLRHGLRQAAGQGGAAFTGLSLLPSALITFLWTFALLTITTYLVLRRSEDTLDHERTRSASERLRQTQTLVRTRDAVIFALAKLAGFRDHETGGHLERISEYATLLASGLRRHPEYGQQVTPAFVRLIGLAAVLHDIGKVGIEDRVLRKPGPLTPQEREYMQRHTVLAGGCLTEIAQRLGSSNFMHMAADIALSHHEHWDGAGYPHALKGDNTPLAARIVAIVDVYDALSTPRVYKSPMPHAECVATIRAAAGSQFDPELVRVWLALEPKFWAIAQQHLKTLDGDRVLSIAGDAKPGPAPPCQEPVAEPVLMTVGSDWDR